MIAQAYIDADRVRASIWRARGGDPLLDQMVSKALRVELSDFSGSTTAAHSLVDRLFPAATLHVGFDALGILPVATLCAQDGTTCETAATVPLAILRAVWTASEAVAV